MTSTVPTSTASGTGTRGQSSSTSSAQSTTRLYVGNLSQTIDEYSLMQLCSKFGKIAKLDYLFHKTGPQKGKPRGYAFIEYSTTEEARRAIVALNDKLIRGRKLTVTPASEQTTYAHEEYRSSALSGRGRGGSSSGGPGGNRHDPHRPSTISLLKGGQGVSANASTDKKIAALEAKLASIRQAKGAAATAAAGGGAGTCTTIPSGTLLSGEQWLDTLTPPTSGSVTPTTTGDGIETADPSGGHEGSGSVGGAAERDGTTEKGMGTGTGTMPASAGTLLRDTIDTGKAGLPPKPLF